MLQYRKAGHRAWPVTVSLMVCAEETGLVTRSDHSFIAHFTIFSESDYRAAFAAAKVAVPAPEGGDDDDLPLGVGLKRNADLYSRLICGWGPEVVDPAGASVPYSVEALTEFVTGPDGMAISAGINSAITELRLGIAPAKNLQTSPSPGPTADEVEAKTNSTMTADDLA